MAKGKNENETFTITDLQKCELGILAVNLKLIDRSFNLHLFLLRRRKIYGHYPPADKVINICRKILKNRRDFKNRQLWPYMVVAVSNEEAMSFAQKNIDEGIKFKKMEPLAGLFSDKVRGKE